MKLPVVFLTELEQIISVCMETQKNLNVKAILRKKNRTGRIIFPDFRLHYKATTIKTVWYWYKKQKYKPREQNRKPGDKSTH